MTTHKQITTTFLKKIVIELRIQRARQKHQRRSCRRLRIPYSYCTNAGNRMTTPHRTIKARPAVLHEASAQLATESWMYLRNAIARATARYPILRLIKSRRTAGASHQSRIKLLERLSQLSVSSWDYFNAIVLADFMRSQAN